MEIVKDSPQEIIFKLRQRYNVKGVECGMRRTTVMRADESDEGVEWGSFDEDYETARDYVKVGFS